MFCIDIFLKPEDYVGLCFSGVNMVLLCVTISSLILVITVIC
jgi:hypothetical protein